ncbi:Cytidylate kinase [Anaplasma phagocytophilum]|uniref:Cytidylate kinase n=1 Tax=Anaplasma phagocytophilum str. Norway variant2 TaxID=1392507 RepID=A0A161IJE2_ANAPH|nr:(d)CMP kinase [Anaplasma phagocytophilum]ANC34025.1 cytidylate kinase [Anaplasma phagocytophilum str. Norway variant2]SCV64447.1 Cytidylate kinase [Anaplasma phagocytophilum]
MGATSLEGNSVRRIVIAIDGPSSSGKGAMASAIAAELGFVHMDTGMLYRIFAAEFAKNYIHSASAENDEICITAEDRCKMLSLLAENNGQYSSEAVGKAASIISRNGQVRAALLPIQQEFVRSSKRGVVLDGRDIATIVCPDADVKIFITAYASIRALRRYKQLRLRHGTRKVMYKNVFYGLLNRDIRDSCRSKGPLRRVKEAYYLNNSHINKEISLHQLMKKIKTFL